MSLLVISHFFSFSKSLISFWLFYLSSCMPEMIFLSKEQFSLNSYTSNFKDFHGNWKAIFYVSDGCFLNNMEFYQIKILFKLEICFYLPCSSILHARSSWGCYLPCAKKYPQRNVPVMNQAGMWVRKVIQIVIVVFYELYRVFQEKLPYHKAFFEKRQKTQKSVSNYL